MFCHRVLKAAPAIAAIAALASCSPDGDGLIDVAVIESTDRLSVDGMRLSYGQQLVRGATSEGLVTLNADGETVPALAERWIVTDEGRSFIFRLREANWADGSPVDAQSVRAEMLRQITALEGTSLGLDLALIDEIRAMTSRVIEIRLSRPMPSFLLLLSQPEFGLRRGKEGTGPMHVSEVGDGVLLTPMPPETRGLPEEQDFADRTRTLRLAAMPAQQAIDAFNDGGVDLVVGGTLASLPLAETGPLSRGNLRLDSAQGLFGLRVTNARDFLEMAERREALSMAIDRSALLNPFNLSGWPSTTRLVPVTLMAEALGPDADSAPQERWSDMPLEARRSRAARRVADWESASGSEASVSIFLPEGPGSDRLFQRLATEFASIGVGSIRAADRAAADLVLVDRLARYTAPRWFLGQFHCGIVRGTCIEEADALVKLALGSEEGLAKPVHLVEAETLLIETNTYIPLGAPVRWSLVRGGLDGFTENRWASHPLLPLAVDPIF